MHRFFLYFRDVQTENSYRDATIERTIRFTQATWMIVAFLAILFSVLDHRFFADNTGLVLKMRLGLVVLAAVMFLMASSLKSKKLMDWNGFIFIFFLGTFCNGLIFLDITQGFSLWFAGLFFVFPGVFTTAGLGFRYSFFAMMTVPVTFNILFFFNTPIQMTDFLFYNVFLGGMLMIYIFTAFLVETNLRRNYIAVEQLKDSIDEVKRLSGLLPICAKCKKIRDDDGYWQQVETYIQSHTEATFSHGLCPVCLDETYGSKKWYKKRKTRESE